MAQRRHRGPYSAHRGSRRGASHMDFIPLVVAPSRGLTKQMLRRNGGGLRFHPKAKASGSRKMKRNAAQRCVTQIFIPMQEFQIPRGSKKKKFTQQKSRKFQNTMEGPHRRPNLPRKKCQSKKPHPQKQPNHQRANKQASRAHNWQNRAYNWDEDSDFGDYLPTHCKKQSNSQHSYTSRNRPAFADPEYHHPKFRQAKAQPPRSRQRTVRHSLKQLFQDYSEEEHDAHPPKHWLSAQSRQQRKKQNATRNHLQSTPTDHPQKPARKSKCHFGAACAHKNNGCPFLHNRREVHQSPGGNVDCGHFKGQQQYDHKHQPARLLPAQLKDYTRALLRLEKHLGHQIYDPTSGKFDVPAVGEGSHGTTAFELYGQRFAPKAPPPPQPAYSRQPEDPSGDSESDGEAAVSEADSQADAAPMPTAPPGWQRCWDDIRKADFFVHFGLKKLRWAVDVADDPVFRPYVALHCPGHTAP